MSFTQHSRQSQNQYSRPLSSIHMVDLPIYVVPLDLWVEQQNLALNEMVNETILAGFIRVEPEQPLSDLRFEIDEQLGYEYIPKDYVFCKNVGRCLAQVREKQESLLKAKHFLPPNSYSPEMFVVDSIVTKRNPMSSDSSKTYNSPSVPEIRQWKRYSDDDLQRQKFENDQKREKQRSEKENEDRLREREERRLEEEEKMKIETARKVKEKEKEFNEKKTVVKPSDDPEMEHRRKEIESLQKEIMQRYEELQSLEAEHNRKVAEWEYEDERRRQEEEERRRLYEEMERERRRQEEAIIAKQREELTKLEAMLKEKQIEIYSTEDQLKLERNRREEIRQDKQKEIEELKVQVEVNAKLDPSMDETIQKLQIELEEMDKKQKELEQVAIAERQQAEIDFQNAQLEFEKLKAAWEEERKLRDKENLDRMSEEKRLRDIYEQNQREHEQRMEEERQRMIAERERFDEEQKHWGEERLQYEEDEKRRLEEMNKEIEDVKNNRIEIPKFELQDPDLILPGASDLEQKNHLKMILRTLKSEREIEEKIRDNAMKKVRILQIKIQNRRNNLKDIWKKKYLDEKKKTPPLEEQLSRYKEELEILHRKLVNSMEVGMKEKKGFARPPGALSPSNRANLLLEAFRIQHDIEDIQQKIGFSELRLAAERKLRAQTEIELKMIKIEAMQKKINLSRTRSDQLAIMPKAHSSDFIYSPHNHSTSNGDIYNTESVNF